MAERGGCVVPTHSILGGKVHLYRRGEGDNWHCSTYYKGKNRRVSTKEDSLPHAEEFAEDWYLELRGKGRAGLLKPTGKTFDQAADQFEKEYGIITQGERSPKWVEGHSSRLRLHLRPFFGDLLLADITAGKLQEYRMERSTQPPRRGGSKAELSLPAEPKANSKAPSRNTIHNEIMTLRQVLSTALRHNWINNLPDLSTPYRGQGKIEHRPWFSPDEYKKLYLAARKHAHETTRAEDKWYAEQLYDYILFMGNTGLRPDEAGHLEHRDVEMVKDQGTGELILEIEVNKGKRGHGFCKSRPEAVKVYQRLLNRPKWSPQGRAPRTKAAMAESAKLPPSPVELPKPTDKIFPGNHIKLFNKILTQNELKFDRSGKARTAYSLRHTYICMRLSERADIYQVAKNCRTSVEMIQKFYAQHIKNTIDASAINTRAPKRRRSTENARMD